MRETLMALSQSQFFFFFPTCEINMWPTREFPTQGSNWDPLHQKHRPPRKSPNLMFKDMSSWYANGESKPCSERDTQIYPKSSVSYSSSLAFCT